MAPAIQEKNQSCHCLHNRRDLSPENLPPPISTEIN
jgi:hypothetical protein